MMAAGVVLCIVCVAAIALAMVASALSANPSTIHEAVAIGGGLGLFVGLILVGIGLS